MDGSKSISLSLDPDLSAWIEENAASCQKTPGDFVRLVLEREKQRDQQDRADLEVALLEGIHSGRPIRATPEFWEEQRDHIMSNRLSPAPRVIELHPRAQADLHEHAASMPKDFAERFIRAVNLMIELLSYSPGPAGPCDCKHPELRGIGQCRVWTFLRHIPRFEYGIYFVPSSTRIRVVRILHQATDPWFLDIDD